MYNKKFHILTILVDLSPHFSATIVKFGTRGGPETSSPTVNFVKKSHSRGFVLKGQIFPKNSRFRATEDHITIPI